MLTAFIHGFTGQQKIDENANESVTCRALKGEILFLSICYTFPIKLVTRIWC